MQDDDGYYGVQKPTDGGDEYNAIAFVVRQILNGRNFAALVKVVNVAGDKVDVQPLVNQLDGQGRPVPHAVVNDIPFVRIQGGANAVIIDPQPGDIGLAVFCDRDSSSVQQTRGAANPGSLRRSDMADGVYFGGLLNGAPSQFVSFTDDGIKVVSPTAIHMEAPRIELVAPEIEMRASTSTTVTTPKFIVNGDTQFNGDTTATGTVTGETDVVYAGKSAIQHRHGLVRAGTDQSGTTV